MKKINYLELIELLNLKPKNVVVVTVAKLCEKY